MRAYLEGEPLIIAGADGLDLIDTRGRRYLDGVSSLWCNLLGHRHPDLDRALQRQLGRVAHSTLLGPTVVPAVRLARRLATLAPPPLERVFFSDNGSTAVEVALKMAFQLWRLRGRTRPRFIALEGGYHGDTLGAVGVGGIPAFHAEFRPLLLQADFAHAPSPFHAAPNPRRDEAEVFFYPNRIPPGTEALRDRCLQQMDELLRQHDGQVAAVIVEPVLQGAAGMRLLAPGYLAGLRRLCDEHDVLLIADEVLTGFGRTGPMFACSHEQVVPDLMALSKGLTGGYTPLAATLAAAPIFEEFLGTPEEPRIFYHGHTYTGHALGCAVALAVLDVLERDRVLEALPERITLLRDGLLRIARHPNVGRVAQVGLVGAAELVADRVERTPFPPEARAAARVCELALEEGLLIRPLGDTLIIMPPLTIPPERLRWLCHIVRRALEKALPENRP
jgi:adenosylmethionine-8-amino-7-oxononanoate aminotransferase